MPNEATWNCVNLQQQKALSASRSLHPGGAQFCFGDGSVKFIAEGIDQTVYRGLATRAGGEVVTAP